MKNTAIYPGTFDPITNGHLDLVERSLRFFDRLIIAVADNPDKKPLFSVEERLPMIEEAVKGCEGVTVESFSGLLVDYARSRGVRAVIRGLRAVSDFEHELQMALMNRKLDQGLETVFLMPSLRYIFLSSTIVKEAASYGGSVEGLVPEIVEKSLAEKFGVQEGRES
jgi:pantetheine-phosphate adenylyltransferase